MLRVRPAVQQLGKHKQSYVGRNRFAVNWWNQHDGRHTQAPGCSSRSNLRSVPSAGGGVSRLHHPVLNILVVMSGFVIIQGFFYVHDQTKQSMIFIYPSCVREHDG